MYSVELMPKAVKELNKLQKQDAGKHCCSNAVFKSGPTGNIKRLTNFTPEYRLRVGSYRVLFEINGHKIVVYRIMHRKEGDLMELHPQLIQKAGRNEFVVLPIEEFEAMTELIETYEELRELRAAMFRLVK